ncbi:MAG: hypothetical protein K2M42_09980 [Oscillospiraceae bacterium]|nr:hypothetical protein [Oscillospiraceae bacterium]
MNFTDIILMLIALLVLAVMIVPAIIDFIIEIKCPNLVIQYRFFGGSCWGMKGCGKDDCRLRRFCYIYQRALKSEDLEELNRLLEERRKELKEKL